MATPHPTDTTRDRILEAARDVYLERGMAGFSMRRVAALSNLTATAIYRHFENKEALLLAVAGAGFEIFGRYLYRGLEGQTPLERLVLSGEGYLRFGLEHPGYYRVMFLSSNDDFGFSKMDSDTTVKAAPSFQFLVDRVRECIDDGAFLPGDPTMIAAKIWSSVHGLVALYLAGKLRPMLDRVEQFEEFYRDTQQTLLRGLSA